MKMLLILTSELDLAADFLIVKLIERRLPYFRLNAEDLGRKQSLFRLSPDGVARRILSMEGRGVDLDDVDAIWYRRALHPSASTLLAPAQRHFVVGELRHLWAGMVLAPEKLWVNPIDRVSIAEHKLFQLRVAQELGFNLPSTIVSSDPRELRRFVRESGPSICKPIFHGLLSERDNRYSAYTRRVSEDSFEDTESIEICPVLLQTEIPRIADLRVTIIGGECFTARITSRENTLVDWRRPGSDVQYSASSIPIETLSLCRVMLQQLGLLYGAFDFIERDDGELVFLEVNPTGEWAWLEDSLGFPMRDAFIRLFFGD